MNFEHDLKAINSIDAIPVILDMICRTTGMGFATVARVTDDRWIACSVLDNISFGLKAGGELKVDTTLCHEVNQYKKGIVVDDFSQDEQYKNHHTPALYGLKSYISIPITLKNGLFFGTLCAIHPEISSINNPQVIGMFNLYAELIALHLDNYYKLEEAENRLLEEKALANLREQFIAILGHDLRNPVGAIKNIAQILQTGTVQPDRTEKLGKMLLNSSHRMIGLIDNLMDFASGRMGSGIQLNKSPEYLEETLNHVINELRLSWPDKVISTQISLAGKVNVDSKRIAQLFSNLLSNALSHGAIGEPVNIAINGNAQHFTLSVKNSGENIPEEVMVRLFEPFSRGSGHEQKEGLGLGLFISAEIAKAHGGILQAFSAEQEIEFLLTIPQAMAAKSEM